MHFEKLNGGDRVGDMGGEMAGGAALEGYACLWVGCPPEGDPNQGHPEGVQPMCDADRLGTPHRV